MSLLIVINWRLFNRKQSIKKIQKIKQTLKYFKTFVLKQHFFVFLGRSHRQYLKKIVIQWYIKLWNGLMVGKLVNNI